MASERYLSHRHLADVGGGSGGLAITIAKACPGLKATVIDQPNVIPFTQKFIEEAGANEEIEALAADAVEGTLSGSYDVAVLSALLPLSRKGPRRGSTFNKSLASGAVQ